MKELIKELRECRDELAKNPNRPMSHDFFCGLIDKIIFHHPAEVEPLAVLADRKGFNIEVTGPAYGAITTKGAWGICLVKPNGELRSEHDDTYSECEAKAREWLEKQTDLDTTSKKPRRN